MNDLMAIEVKDIIKKYPDFTLDVEYLAFPRGTILGLLGPNGAGKSTIIKAMMNLVGVDRGNISLLGMDHRREEIKIKKQVGYVPEECNLYEEASAGWLGQFVSKYYEDWDHRFYQLLLEKFGVESSKKVKKLSKGGKMKLSLCLALAHRPSLLLLDEPTSGLDPVVRHQFLKELLEVIQDESRSVLFSSHIVSDIEKVADYVAFMRGGQIVLCDQKDDLLDKWRRVSFRAADSGAAERLKGYMAYYKEMNQNYQGVSGGCGDDLRQKLAELGAENVNLHPMSLEEIMIVISRGEV